MDIIEIVLIGVGLAMDAFAVAICKGLSMKHMNWKKSIIIGCYFGIFQALMPAIRLLSWNRISKWCRANRPLDYVYATWSYWNKYD